MIQLKQPSVLKVNWSCKEMDNLSLCGVRSPKRKEIIRLAHLRSLLESKKLYRPYHITLTGSV